MSDALGLIHPRNLKHLSDSVHHLLVSELWAQVLLGMVLGIAVGFTFSPTAGLVSPDTATVIGNWLVLPGNVFLAIIQMIVVPLVVASVIRGIAASGSTKQLRSTGLRLVAYFLCTTTIAISIGIGVSMLLQPGTHMADDAFIIENAAAGSVSEIEDNIEARTLDLAELPTAVVSILPANPLSAAVEMEMLQIVLFSIIFGLALVSLAPSKAKPLLELLGSLQHVVMRVVGWVMYLAPYAVFGFIAQITMQTGLEALWGIGYYTLTILTGLALLMLFYVLVMWVVGRVSPWRFLSAARELQLLAFSTNSSVAVMPVTMRTAEEKLNVRPSTTQFVIPIGATVNMDGTALFHGAATLFLTQVYGIEMSIGMLLALVATAIGASIGTPATPGVGIIILSVVLSSVGIPVEGVALIVGIDRVLELFRTATNVTGDLVAATVIDRFVPNVPSYAEEMESQQAIEATQEATGEDVVTGDFRPKTPPKERGVWDTLTHYLHID